MRGFGVYNGIHSITGNCAALLRNLLPRRWRLRRVSFSSTMRKLVTILPELNLRNLKGDPTINTPSWSFLKNCPNAVLHNHDWWLVNLSWGQVFGKRVSVLTITSAIFKFPQMTALIEVLCPPTPSDSSAHLVLLVLVKGCQEVYWIKSIFNFNSSACWRF